MLQGSAGLRSRKRCELFRDLPDRRMFTINFFVTLTVHVRCYCSRNPIYFTFAILYTLAKKRAMKGWLYHHN
ncbi:hypothetical protein M378DRAFT_818401 [Amanita muscaria Koide BX008]|uniref:Uncharacterized protein n=1 Tax=Amanita muscaria (strain Koide BX008) TaxID=946122 RepID=A0A0C2T5H5_AMAMK|nr:hypothetical protein M378DRAFT_818401 [Amanita muscaria Koide BX008]